MGVDVDEAGSHQPIASRRSRWCRGRRSVGSTAAMRSPTMPTSARRACCTGAVDNVPPSNDNVEVHAHLRVALPADSEPFLLHRLAVDDVIGRVTVLLMRVDVMTFPGRCEAWVQVARDVERRRLRRRAVHRGRTHRYLSAPPHRRGRSRPRGLDRCRGRLPAQPDGDRADRVGAPGGDSAASSASASARRCAPTSCVATPSRSIRPAHDCATTSRR